MKTRFRKITVHTVKGKKIKTFKSATEAIDWVLEVVKPETTNRHTIFGNIKKNGFAKNNYPYGYMWKEK